jgi:hypothetical protein
VLNEKLKIKSFLTRKDKMNFTTLYKLALLITLVLPLSVNAAIVKASDELEITAEALGPDFQSDFLSFDYTGGEGLQNTSFEITNAYGEGISEYRNNGQTKSYENTWFKISGHANRKNADLTLDIYRIKNNGQKRNLLQGTLSNWSYAVDNTVGAVFNFVFTDLSGVLAADYGNSAAVMFADTAFAANFNFRGEQKTSGSTGRADTVKPVDVPEPAALYLMLMGLAFLTYRNQRKT